MAQKGNSETEYKFTKDELADFKRFWHSKVGEKYMKKIKDTKDQLLDAAMGSMDNDYILRSTAIANGFQSVIVDVETIIKASEELNKAENEKENENG